jgi:hypothetical protein
MVVVLDCLSSRMITTESMLDVLAVVAADTDLAVVMAAGIKAAACDVLNVFGGCFRVWYGAGWTDAH